MPEHHLWLWYDYGSLWGGVPPNSKIPNQPKLIPVDPLDAKSIGNRLLSYIDVIPEIDLPNRVQLVPELEHFVGRPPKNPAQAGISSLLL